MKICMVVRSRVRVDSRVLRIGDALVGAGHDVRCVGYSSTGEAPHWPLTEIDGASLAGARRLQHAALLPLARVGGGWKAAYWSDARVRRLYEAVAADRPDVVHAHDWDTLPVAMRIAEETGCRVVYDAHEFAAEEYVDSTAWKLVYAPFTKAIERMGIRRANAVITVSNSIALELQRRYRLSVLPTVVRNIPDSDRFAPTPVGEDIRVLYHGGITRHRGLVDAARSTHRWPANYSLTIRGDAPAELLAEITANAAPGKLTMVPAVKPGDVVVEANAFDIGLHPSVGAARNDEFSLPNKFFEYLNAGLALCIADLPEMAALIREHGVGELIGRPVSPDTITAAVTSLTPDRIWAAKQASARLATTLTWPSEAEHLTRLYEERLSG